jgi:hypothetical protein
MGIFASVILMPTFDHAARGSNVTPRCTKALAKSFRRVFSVFVLRENKTKKGPNKGLWTYSGCEVKYVKKVSERRAV